MMASKDIQTKLSIKQRNYFSKRHHGKSKDFAPKIAVPEKTLETKSEMTESTQPVSEKENVEGAPAFTGNIFGPELLTTNRSPDYLSVSPVVTLSIFFLREVDDRSKF